MSSGIILHHEYPVSDLEAYSQSIRKCAPSLFDMKRYDLFADTEISEDSVENILDIDAPG